VTNEKTETLEIRIHGRGGQGAVVASKTLATAAFLEDRGVQSYPTFGVERRGAPVSAFVRIGSGRIRNRSMAMLPHHLIVLDPSLIQAVDCFTGLRPGGTALINAAHLPEGTKEGVKITLVDAAQIAAKHGLGTRAMPIVNTAILGAFAKSTGVVQIESVVKAIRMTVGIKEDENEAAAREAYESVQILSASEVTK
jgi:2-oxoacid:acceptor oxidoreductase gamma subunit (pyruvate/2-ketoisovalerate family)